MIAPLIKVYALVALTRAKYGFMLADVTMCRRFSVLEYVSCTLSRLARDAVTLRFNKHSEVSTSCGSVTLSVGIVGFTKAEILFHCIWLC